MDRRWLALAAVTLLIVSGSLWWATRPRTTEAPVFVVESTGFHNGTQEEAQAMDLGAQLGKVVVLDLMAVNCAACQIFTHEVLEPLWSRHAHEPDFVLWSIDVWAGLPGTVGETRDDLVRLQKEEGVPWPHALDTDSVYTKYAAAGLPKLVVIDADGGIVLASSAPSPPSLKQVERAIRQARAGEGGDGIPAVGIVALAGAAGVAAVFSPCSAGLIPAYLGLLLAPPGKANSTEATGASSPRSRRPGPLRGAGLVTAGVVAAYGVLALLLWPLGALVRDAIPFIGLAVGLSILAIGVAMLVGVDWSRLTRRVAPPDGRKGFLAFGVGYGLASFGCTGPIFLPIIFGAFAKGLATGLGAFVLYVGAVGVLMCAAAILVSLGRDRIISTLVRRAAVVQRIVAVTLVVGGFVIVAYDLTALR